MSWKMQSENIQRLKSLHPLPLPLPPPLARTNRPQLSFLKLLVWLHWDANPAYQYVCHALTDIL